MKTKLNRIGAFALLIIGALALACQSLLGQGSTYVVAANTYDAAVKTHDCAVNRTNDAAISARHLLYKKGSADGGIAAAGVTDYPLGTVDNIETGTGINQSVLLLGRGPTKKMVASAAIAVGARVATAASGKVRTMPGTTGTYPCVGIALTPAGADNDIIEVSDCVPHAVAVA